jgi:predicted Mrr-cat superfamily restriction endonuclease
LHQEQAGSQILGKVRYAPMGAAGFAVQRKIRWTASCVPMDEVSDFQALRPTWPSRATTFSLTFLMI